MMATIRRFEDLKAWQKARVLTRAVYGITSSGQWAKDYGLRDQICRAVVSVMSNIAEGFERRGDIEFIRYLVIAKASSAQVRSQLYVALDLGYIDEATFESTKGLAEEISSVIAGLVAYLKGKYLSGKQDARE
jgi:four helix bundle protein